MRLKQELAEIRGSGYALGLEELEVGLNAVAAPVFDHLGENVAAVSVTAPPSRLSESQIREKTAPQVVACADEISRALGYVALQRPAL